MLHNYFIIFIYAIQRSEHFEHKVKMNKLK